MTNKHISLANCRQYGLRFAEHSLLASVVSIFTIPGPSIQKQVWKEDTFEPSVLNNTEFLFIFKGSFLLYALGRMA